MQWNMKADIEIYGKQICICKAICDVWSHVEVGSWAQNFYWNFSLKSAQTSIFAIKFTTGLLWKCNILILHGAYPINCLKLSSKGQRYLDSRCETKEFPVKVKGLFYDSWRPFYTKGASLVNECPGLNRLFNSPIFAVKPFAFNELCTTSCKVESNTTLPRLMAYLSA